MSGWILKRFEEIVEAVQMDLVDIFLNSWEDIIHGCHASFIDHDRSLEADHNLPILI